MQWSHDRFWDFLFYHCSSEQFSLDNNMEHSTIGIHQFALKLVYNILHYLNFQEILMSITINWKISSNKNPNWKSLKIMNILHCASKSQKLLGTPIPLRIKWYREKKLFKKEKIVCCVIWVIEPINIELNYIGNIKSKNRNNFTIKYNCKTVTTVINFPTLGLESLNEFQTQIFTV